jgi:chemotaxis protein CheC
MDDAWDLQAAQLDALKEVGNIGAGHAATALSQMTHRRIMITVPRVGVTRLEDVPALVGEPQQVVAAVLLHLLGDLTGRVVLVFPERAAWRLCDLLLKRPAGTTTSFGALERSSLQEAGNILCGAHLNALSSFMGMLLLPSTPTMVADVAAAVLTSACLDFGSDRDYVFAAETEFLVPAEGETLRGHFLLVPDLVSLRAILRALRLP